MRAVLKAVHEQVSGVVSREMRRLAHFAHEEQTRSCVNARAVGLRDEVSLRRTVLGVQPQHRTGNTVQDLHLRAAPNEIMVHKPDSNMPT